MFNNICKWDETHITFPKVSIMLKKGTKHVGIVTSVESGQLISIFAVVCINVPFLSLWLFQKFPHGAFNTR